MIRLDMVATTPLALRKFSVGPKTARRKFSVGPKTARRKFSVGHQIRHMRAILAMIHETVHIYYSSNANGKYLILIVKLTTTISIIIFADDMSQATSSSSINTQNVETVEAAVKRFAAEETDSLDAIKSARTALLKATVEFFETEEGVRGILLTFNSLSQIK